MTSARRFLAAAILLGLFAPLVGCAYYNTFYLAKRYYNRSLIGVPYPVDKTDLAPSPQFNRSIELSKKLMAQYEKSDWVDDAYLLWAKNLVATDDPRQAVKMLEDFDLRFPKSPIAGDAMFYLGVASLRARKYDRALKAFDDFLARDSKRKELEPYAHLERARTLIALERPAEATLAAAALLERWPKHELADRARVTHAQAQFAQRSYDAARADYRALGRRASTDDDRLNYLLSEAECLEAAERYDEALALLHDALAHAREPIVPPDTGRGGRVYTAPTGPGADHFGRLLVRIGTVQLHANRFDDAVVSWRRAVVDYPRTAVAAEAQYRLGHAYETEADDFDKARVEYGHVREHAPTTTFADQASSRIANLDRLAQYRKAGGDSLDKVIEGRFLLAEQYLFQLDKPERAIEEYKKIEQEYPGTPHAAKAINAQAWVMGRKLNRKAEADSLFWRVVREHPATEAQLAARDYLEGDGIEVPPELIKLPEPPAPPPDSAAVDTALMLTPPPSGPYPLGSPLLVPGSADSLRLGPHAAPYSLPPMPIPPDSTGMPGGAVLPAPVDSTRHAAPDTSRHVTAPPPPPPAPPRDTTRSDH